VKNYHNSESTMFKKIHYSLIILIAIISFSFNAAACDTTPIVTASNPVNIGGGFFTFDLQVCIGSDGSQDGFDVTMNCGLNITATSAATLTNAGKVATASIAGGVLTYTYPSSPPWWEVDDGISGPCFNMTLTVNGNPANCTATVTGINDGCMLIATSWSATVPGPCIVDFTMAAPGTLSSTTAGAGNDCALRSSLDRVIQVNIPCTGAYTFSLCSGTTWDTYLYLGTSCCGGVTSQNDDGCGLQSSITATLGPGTYYIMVEAFGSSSGAFTLGITRAAACPLPVELVHFDGEYVQLDRVNRLTWKTVSEHNNDYFELQKSYDGMHYQTIDIIDGNGNSNEVIEYSYDDNNLGYETNYYRLRQVDFDGAFEYSNIIAISNNLDTDYFISEIFPNPASSTFEVKTKTKNLDINLEIVNSTGQFIQGEVFSASKAVINRTVDVSKLKPGVYLVRFIIGEKVKVQKLIIH